MPHSSFQFKQFTVWHDRCAMKVGTDGVLLGAWVDVQNVHTVLDIGTGSGLVALMLAQRCAKDTRIIGVEIDPEAAAQAKENVERSPWPQQIDIVQADFRHHTFDSSFDLIVSNPPYFHEALACPNAQRRLARHTDTLTYDELLVGATALLSPRGRLCLILPSEASALVEQKAQTQGLHTLHRTHILTKPGEAPKRTILSFSLEFAPTQESILPIRNTQNEHSSLYIDLTKSYYLNIG